MTVLLLSAGLLGLLGLFGGKKKSQASASPGAFERLPNGQLARVRVVAPPAYVESMRSGDLAGGQQRLLDDLTARVERLGFGGTILVSQDPTDNRSFTLLARSKGGTLTPGDDAVRIVGVDPVEEPPSGVEKPDPRSTGLDAGLSADEVATVRYALAEEHHPAHLWGLAVTLEPSFPIAAAKLQARRRDLEEGPSRRSGGPRSPTASREQIAGLKGALDAYGAAHGIPSDLLREEVRRTTCLLAGGQPGEAPGPVLAAARACAPAYGTIDRRALEALCPVGPKDTFVSPAAVNLALSSSKPRIAGVRDAAQGRSVRSAITAEELPRDPVERSQRLRARSAMMRAQKAIERRRWVEWYRRVRAWK